MSPASFLRYLLLPATSFTVLVFVAAVSLGIGFGLNGGLLGYPMVALLSVWVFNYAFMLLEAIANGAREVPVLPIEVLNPVHEWRPVFHFGIVIAMVVLLGMVAAFVDARVAGALAVLCFVALPAFTGALAVGSSTWHSLNPVALWHIARSLAASYVAIVAVVLLYGLITRWLVLRHCPAWPVAAWGIFAWLSVFTLIGGCLYEHRIELGHDATDSPERREQRRQAELDRTRRQLLDRVQAQARNGNLAGAWATIEDELAQQRHGFATYEWLLDALSEREDLRLARRLAQDYVARALGRDNARATQIAQRGLTIDADFRPRSGAQCLRVAELLRLAGDRQSAEQLLRNFAIHFPGDPAITDAHSLLAELSRR